jgi:RNA polymerase sigma factor (sigma-70 family)
MQGLYPSSSSPACPVPWTFPDETQSTGAANRSEGIHPFISLSVLSDDLLTDASLSGDTGPLADDHAAQTFADIRGETFDLTRSEEERWPIERARAGDYEARAALIVEVLPNLQRIAYWYAYTYGWAYPHLDPEDLVQDACLHLWERLDDILARDNPRAYLLGCTRHQIRWRVVGLAEHPRSLSLDAPIFDDGETPLHECIPTSILPPSPYAQERREYQALYQALARLPQHQRLILEAHYGLGDHAPSSYEQAGQEVAEQTGNAALARPATAAIEASRARASLFTALRETSSAYRDARLPLSEEVIPSLPRGSLTGPQRARLDAAYTQLRAQGQPITITALLNMAHVRYHAAARYLWEREPQRWYSDSWSKESLRARLDAAYAELEAEKGEVSTNALRKAARVSHEAALLYLKERQAQLKPSWEEVSEPSPGERLDTAYAELEAAGRAFGTNALARLAGVSKTTARNYLRQHNHVPTIERAAVRAVPVEQRLDQAYAQLEAEGRTIAISTLARAAHVDYKAAADYLKRHNHALTIERAVVRAVPAEQRMDQAYAELQATGRPFAAEALARMAHVSQTVARDYLKRHNHAPTIKRAEVLAVPVEQRLERAYAQLQAEGRPIGTNALVRLAHVPTRVATDYLKHRI